MTVSPFFFASGTYTEDQRWFPAVVNVTETPFGSNTTAHNANFPATVTAGNLLLLIWSNDGTATVTTPTNFSVIYNNVTSTAVSCCYAKIAAGNEGGTTIGVTTSAIEAASAQIYQISGWSGNLSNIASATATGGTGTTRACPSLTPGFGASDALWIVAAHRSAAETVSTLPTGFTNLTQTIGTAGTNGGQTTTGRALMRIATLSPGNFTLSGTTTASWTTATIAVKGQY